MLAIVRDDGLAKIVEAFVQTSFVAVLEERFR
jgi:hypothetical protein